MSKSLSGRRRSESGSMVKHQKHQAVNFCILHFFFLHKSMVRLALHELRDSLRFLLIVFSFSSSISWTQRLPLGLCLTRSSLRMFVRVALTW